MAISLVSGGNLGGLYAISGGNVSATLPTLAENDVVYLAYANANATHSVVTSGYTQLGSTINYGTLYVSLWRKRMGASPDGSVEVSGGGNTAHGTSMVVYCLSGVDTTTSEDVTPTTAGAAANADPNPPSITPTTAGAWVLAIGAANCYDASVTVPTGYANMVQSQANDVDDSTVAIAWKQWSGSGAEDPGTFSAWATTSAWVGISVAVRPAADVASVKDMIGGGWIAFAR